MTKLISILLLTCATLHAQSVIVKGTGAGNIRGTGAGSVRGVAVAAHTDYCDGKFRIFDSQTNVVLDTENGITWTRDAGIGNEGDWTNAVDYCDNLETNGYSDWRLPSVAKDGGAGEWESLTDTGENQPALTPGHPFINVRGTDYYWSSITLSADTNKAWVLDMVGGAVGSFDKTSPEYPFYIWPCRGP